METTIKIFDTAEGLAHHFATLLISQLKEIPDDGCFSWVLSGGSTPKIVFREIASKYRNSVDWKRVKIFWGDERCVPPDDEESNYRMARENLLDHVPIPLPNIFRMRGEAEPVAEAARYGEIFSRQVNVARNLPQADLVMLGLGEDGHTASIFPGNTDLFDSPALFETVVYPETKQKRITATGKIINHAKLVVILATGESKASRVAQVINHLDGWNELPAGHVNPENGEVIWLLDKMAAKELAWQTR
jgi:6-phosphogluconolactonase